MGSVLAKTVRYKDVFPKDFKKHTFGDIQIVDPEVDKQFSGSFETKEGKLMSGGYSGYRNFNRPFNDRNEHPRDDVIMIYSDEKDKHQRGQSLIHETTHKISRTPDTFSKQPDTKHIIDTYFNDQRMKVGEVLRDYKPEKIWNELVSLQSEADARTLYKTPKEKYEKEFYKQFKSPETQRRLYEPDLIEYPLAKFPSIYEESGVSTKSLKVIETPDLLKTDNDVATVKSFVGDDPKKYETGFDTGKLYIATKGKKGTFGSN
jgi:hypothetical protein